MEPVEITLNTPVEWAGTMVHKVTIKPPRSKDYLKLGEPRIPVRNADGMFYFIEKDDVISKYMIEMIDHDASDLLVPFMNFVDAKRVKGAVLSFFDRAEALIYAPPSAPSCST